MELAEFQRLSRDQVAQLVRQAGTKVCVFPVKGTRRWFMMEHSGMRMEDPAAAYLEAMTRRSVALYRMMFDHGLDTLLSPSFSPDVMARGAQYMEMAAEGLANPVTHPEFVRFCEEYEVSLRFYGDYHRFLESTPYAHLSALYDEAMARTAGHDRRRLFMGMFAHDPMQTIAELAIRYHGEHGRAPDKRELIRLYYGEYIDPVDLFIGFGKLRAFDMPLVTTGREDLYFMISPSLYLTEPQLREILYDHLYARSRTDADLSPGQVRGILRRGSDDQGGAQAALEPAGWALMRDFYEANLGRTLGVGAKSGSGVWYPLPQVKLPPQMAGGDIASQHE